MQNKRQDLLTYFEAIHSSIYVISAVILLSLNIIICAFTSVDPAILGGIFLGIYAVVSLVVYIIGNKKLKIFRQAANAAEEQSQSVIYAFKRQLKLPYVVIGDHGKIITANSAFENLLNLNESLFSLDLSTLLPINLENLLEISNQKIINSGKSTENFEDIPLKDVRRAEITEIREKKFRMECYPLVTKGKTFQMIFFYDITEISNLAVQYKNKHTAIGYIAIDNLEEIAQYVKVSYRDETQKVGKILSEWVSNMGGILCEYENNKFLVLFTQEMLSECTKNKFSILNEVQKITIGDANIPLTVSIGVATSGETLEEREHDAMVSLDMALQRGGDQVVLKNPNGIFYFGAKTKALQKRTRGHGKIIYAKLASLIGESSNILIMGHKNPDFDSIGACIGVATLIKNTFKDKNTKIVTDINSENFIRSTTRLRAISDYKNMFIDGISALEYNSAETLLIIVDANNLAIVESPDLAKNSFKIAIIDHHIKKEEFSEEPALAYIDPSASSTCELVSEILEEILPPEISFKEEANVILSGIMLDTKNFTRTVGMRTFASALYLKNAGADPEYARTFFEESFDDYLSEAQFGSNARIYNGCIAISSAEGIGGANGRIFAAKASDKLLTVKNVNAAFALITIEGTVHISARSNGSINVQLIMEQLGGGGHFDVAGVALENTTLEDAEKLLINAIDTYFANSSAEDDSENK